MKKAYRGLICTECGMEHEDGIYQRCLNCGMPAANCLRANYEFDLLRKVGLKGIIDRNKNSIWRYKTFLPVLDAANIVSLGEGFTPIVTCRNLGKKYHYEEFYVMNEGVNPTHSFKDRGVSVFVSKAVELGGKVLAASSAGNLGTSVAAYSSKIGKKCFIIIPASTRFERLRQLMVFRPIILPLRGSVDDVHDFTSEVYERFGWFDINWALRPFYIEGMKTIAFEISERFNWSPAKKSPGGRGYGLACGMDAGTYVAMMAEVEVDKNKGEVQVKRVVCAQDMGVVINPQGATLQIEGCITMGLGYALTEEIQFKGGDILNRNFDTYQIPQFSWVPQIETVLIEAHDSPPQGGGEPAIICMGGVIANAIFDATGVRLFQLPMTPERIVERIQ